MKAIQITETGGPEVMKHIDLPDPEPGVGQALVDIQAVGVNFTDVYGRAGVIPPATLPWIPGVEGAGVVSAVGSGVTEVAVGDVVAYSGVPGSYAERTVAPAAQLVKMPDGLDATSGATAMLQGMTAHYLCHSTYPIQAGDVALVHAGAGGVGLILTQMVKALGGTVISTVSTEAKAQQSQDAGADHVINYVEDDFEARVNEITGGAGIQVAYDSVGKTTFDKSVACLAPRGYMVLYGQASGPPAPMNPGLLGAGSLYLTRPGLGDYVVTRGELEQRAGDVLGWVKSGELKLRVEHVFPLSDAVEAHRQLESRATTGKLLIP